MADDTLCDYLANRLRATYRSLARALEGLTEAQALEGARADWQQYRWGVGLDGSIAGIVRHAAAWKQIFAEGLTTGTFPAETEVGPPGADWPALRGWLADGQARLERAFEPLSGSELSELREWEGQTAPLFMLWTYVIEHDSYHAGQVELLRQLGGYPHVED